MLLIFGSTRQAEELDSASVTSQEYLKMATRTESLQAAPGLTREDKPIVEFSGLNEDFVAKHEVPERDHHRSRGFLEHPDDDAIVAPNGQTLSSHDGCRGQARGERQCRS
jgi:hypothetical protein